MTKRAVLLARQSLKKSPDSVSISEQIGHMQRYCADKGYAVAAVIESENVRGTREREKRADLTEIEALADDGEFDVLIVYKIDRLARYLRVQENVIYELERHDVTLESSSEPIVNSVMGRQLLGMISEQFSRDLSQRQTLMTAAHVRMGKHMGKAPLGFVRGDDDHLHIDPETEQAARDLFAWRLEGHGSPALRERLQEQHGVTISCEGILRWLANPVYIGAVTGPNELFVEGAHPPLIDRATWEAVQVTLHHRRSIRQKRQGSWLEGLVRCGCGLPMYLVYNDRTWQGRRYVYWKFRCKSTLGNGATPCAQPVKSISKTKLERAILTQLEAMLASLTAMRVETFIAKTEQQRTRQFPGWQRRQTDLTAKLQKAKRRQDAINEARLDHRMSRDEANRRYRALATEIASYEQELTNGPRPVDKDALAMIHAAATKLAAADMREYVTEFPEVVRTFVRQIGATVVLRDGAPMLDVAT